MRRFLGLFASFFVIISAIAVIADATPVEADTSVAAGVVFISAGTAPMDQQLEWAQGLRIAKIHIEHGSGYKPEFIGQLAAAGAEWIIGRTPDCRVPEPTYTVDVVRPFVEAAQRHGVAFTVELCNEPTLPGPETQIPIREQDPTGWSDHAWAFRWYAVETARQLHAAYPDVTVACCGFFEGNHGADYMRIALLDVAHEFDFISVHAYGWSELRHIGAFDHALDLVPVAQEYDRPILITEAGIHDVAISKRDKAARYIEFLDRLPDDVKGVTFFAATSDASWPGYGWDSVLTIVLHTRDGPLDTLGSTLTGDSSATSVTVFDVTGTTLSGGFLAFWERYGGLQIFGYPITNEFQEDGRTVQYFERARFEWHPGVWPEGYDVLLGRLGSDVYSERYEAR